MAPREPDDVSEHETASNSADEEDSMSDSANLLNEVSQDDEMDEEEFHTEESDDEEDPEEPDPPNGAPLLPENLLKQQPSSGPTAVDVPWEQMTRKQKQTARKKSILAKKKEWERLRAEAGETGALEAGRVAQVKRGVVPGKKAERVRTGRIEKARRPKASGRQQLIEHRKRAVDEVPAVPKKPLGHAPKVTVETAEKAVVPAKQKRPQKQGKKKAGSKQKPMSKSKTKSKGKR